MSRRALGIVMNGVTGRMGTNQHLIRSIVGDPRAGRRAACRTATRACPTRSWSAATPTKLRGARQGARRSSAGPPTSTRALANPAITIFFDAATTQMRAGTAARRRSPPASTSTARSRSPPTSTTALDLPRCAQGAGVKHGVVQDKLFLPGLRKLKLLRRPRLLRPHPVGARRVRLLGVRGRLAAGAAAVVELPRRGRRRHHPRHALPLALRARQPVRRRCSAVSCLGATHIPERVDESGQALHGDRRRRGLRDVRARRRRHRAVQLVVGDARPSRRAASTFQVDGTHGSGRRRPARCVMQHRGQHAEAGLEPRHRRRPIDFYADLAGGARQRGVRQRLQGAVGDVPAPRRGGHALPCTLLEGAKGVQLAELCAAELAGAALDRRAGVGGVRRGPTQRASAAASRRGSSAPRRRARA